MSELGVPEWYTKPVLVLGCGNILLGDDGFGPAVIEYLEQSRGLPDEAAAVDAGTGVREILFNLLLAERRPKRVIIVDAVDKGRSPGEVFEIPLEDIPSTKTDDFSMHQVPSSNLLKELRDQTGVEVRIVAAQVHHVTTEVQPGLSEEIKSAIPKAAERVAQLVREIGHA